MLVRQFQNGKAIFGDCLETVKTVEIDSIDCVITSPPYLPTSYRFAEGG